MRIHRSFLALCILSLTGTLSAANVDISYPTSDEPSFIITAPESWEMTPAEELGDYFDLGGPTGATFSFRTIEGSEDAITTAMEELLATANEYYDNVSMGDPQDWNPDGLTGFYMIGEGTDEDGAIARIGMAWCALNDGTIAEVWFNSDLDDSKGIAAAEKIMNSLTAP